MQNKASILRDIDEGLSYRDAAKKWRISRNALANCIKDRNKICIQDETGHKPKFDDIENATPDDLYDEIVKEVNLAITEVEETDNETEG